MTLRREGSQSSTSHSPDPGGTAAAAPEVWNWSGGLSYVWRHRLLVATFSTLVLTLTIVYFSITPDYYSACAILLPPQAPGKVSSLTTLAPGLMSLAGAEFATELSRASDLYPTIIRSESVILPLLTTVFPTSPGAPQKSVTLADVVKTVNPHLGLERVRDLIETEVLRKTGACKVTVTLEDPSTAAAVCNALVDALAERGIVMHTSGAARVREFLAGRLIEVQHDLREAEQELTAFREKNRNFGYASDPNLQLSDERLLRDVALKSQLYMQVTTQYEMARIEENRDVADVLVLDVAEIPTTKSGPYRIRGTLFAGLSSIMVASVLLLVWSFMQFTWNQRVVAIGLLDDGIGTRRREAAEPRSASRTESEYVRRS